MALIDIKEMTKIFKMGHETIRALDHVSLTIQKGEFISIMGPSGSGKSTLMNILGLLDQPTHGQYHLEERPVQSLSDNERANLRNQKIGFVFQTFHLLPRATALRNVEMPLVYSASYDQSYSQKKIRELALDALAKVSLSDRISHQPNELSGGQRQRVAIARALVNRPRLLLADEPTGNLDSKSGKEILDLFEKLNAQGMTLIVVTHDSNIATRAKRVISMLDGKIQPDGYAIS